VRVVVCDNDDVALDLVMTDLRLEGHDIVATAVTGEEAVDRCAETAPDVLVVDLRMPPGIDGVEAARRVLDARPTTRIVLHTNHLDSKALAASAELGIAYVLKADLRALRKAVLGP
jgi:CheY-like chemotaxis protein